MADTELDYGSARPEDYEGTGVVILGIPEVLANNEHLLSKFMARCEVLLDRIAGETEALAQNNAPGGWTRELSQGIQIESPDQYTRLVVATAPHSAAVEYGSAPHFPPVSELETWASYKLGTSKGVYRIAESISSFGTPAQPYMRPAFETEVPRAIGLFQELVAEISGKSKK